MRFFWFFFWFFFTAPSLISTTEELLCQSFHQCENIFPIAGLGGLGVLYPTNYPIDNVISSFKAVADRCPTFGNIPKGGLPSRLLLNAVVVTSEVSEVNQRRMEVISMHRCQNYACEIVKYDLRIVYMGIELFLISYFVFPIQLLPFSICFYHQKPICYPKP